MSDDEFELVVVVTTHSAISGARTLTSSSLRLFLRPNHPRLAEQGISVRRAHELAGFAAADFSRVRQAKLQRFTVDRLMQILGKLDQDVEVSVNARPRSAAAILPRL